MYLRFATEETDTESLVPRGCLQAACALADSGELSESDAASVNSLRTWFNKNLEVPNRFSRSTSKAQHKKRKGIAWFKDSAVNHIGKMRELANILELHGISVRQLNTDQPGYILYEDEFQVFAEPFKGTPV